MELAEANSDSFFLTRTDDVGNTVITSNSNSMVGNTCCCMATGCPAAECGAIESDSLGVQALIINGRKHCGGKFNGADNQDTAGGVSSK